MKGDKLQMEVRITGPKTAFELLGIPITETIINTWIIMIVLIVGAYLLTRNFKRFPSGTQNTIEMMVEGVNGFTAFIMGEKRMGFAPYFGTLIVYLFLANTMGLLGFRPPTADINTTAALATLTFIAIHYYGIRAKGWHYLKGFTEPFILFLPMNIIGEIAKPFSLAFRLFGNIAGGVIIMGIIYSLMPVGIPAPLHIYFDLFAGLIQTFVFTVLSMVFIQMAID